MQDTSALIDETAKLTCGAKGIPTPTYKWTKDGKPVDPNENQDIESDSSSTTLRLSNVHLTNEGCYEVVAINEAGEAKTKCQLKIHGEGIQVVFRMYNW